MSDPVRNIYKGKFVAKEKLVAAEARIAELEKVAEAAEEWAWRGDSCPVEWRNKLEAALRAAGYLKN